MIKQKLIDKFGGVINHMSCIYLRKGEERLRSFLEGKKFNSIIEIGTYQGVSACVLSEYSKKVHTIDIIEMPLSCDIFRFLEKDNITKYIIENDKKKKELIDKIFKNEKVDLCFIDGEHYNDEFEKDFNMLKECNNIIVHDYATNFKDVYDFINDLEGWDKEINDTFVLLTRKDKPKMKVQHYKEDSAIPEYIPDPEEPYKPKKKRKSRKKSTKI